MTPPTWYFSYLRRYHSALDSFSGFVFSLNITLHICEDSKSSISKMLPVQEQAEIIQKVRGALEKYESKLSAINQKVPTWLSLF